MTNRADYKKLSAESFNAMVALERALSATALEPILIDLVKIRASQLNGCLFCLDIHVKEARTHGDRELRLHHLAVWRESALFSPREKAALEWAELLTKPGIHGVEDADYARVSERFSEKELSDLTFAIAAINAWNRLGIAFRSTPGAMDKALGLDKIGLK